jgi:O-antigen/teichoic acid export membrane protein
MEWAVQSLAALAQTLFAVAAVWTVLDIQPTLEFTLAAVAFTLTRNIASHFADRARAHFEITAYSIIQITGSLFGFLIGLAAVAYIAPTPQALLWSYAAAQAAGLLLALPLMRVGIRLPRFDRVILAAAWRYGAPLFIASVLVWVGSHSIRFIVQADLGVEAVGYVTVGWWLGLRLTAFASMLVTGASFSIAVEKIRQVGPHAASPA